MGKSLVIVESPAKAKTLSRYLGKNYIVKASVGHIKDLPKSKLGVDVENDFAPHYHVIPGKEKIVRELRAAAKDSEAIYLAADPDREGEAICQHLAEELTGGKKKPVYRVLFHEITKNAIQEAFKKPGKINSAQGRRPADAPDPGPPGRLQDQPAALGKSPQGPLGGTRPDGRAAPHRGTRAGDPRLQDPRNTGT